MGPCMEWMVICSVLLCLGLLPGGMAAEAGAPPNVSEARLTAARAALIRGISYGPTPLKSIVGASQLPSDDWFCDEAVPMWGSAGRGDLKVMKDMGANLVRLYGNNPELDHTNFLDEAQSLGLGVAPGMSDYPYYQQRPGSCKDTDYNCFSQIKALYLLNLRNGFLTTDSQYHPALRYMNILNEPDLKMPSTADIGGMEDVVNMCKALVSAFDGMLDAEKEAGVTGPLINFTTTFSYAICSSCNLIPEKPALGQMAQLDDAMRHPGRYGYQPKNDVTSAYLARFTHSFNTQNPATDLQHQFLDYYNVHFPDTPVYIGEYHRVDANQTEDLDTILGLAEVNPLFLGISFFQYQVAYWKEGTEMDFGMFALGDTLRARMPYFSSSYDVWCLETRESPQSNGTMADAVARAYGGAPIDNATLCLSNPLGVPLNQTGFAEIEAQGRVSQMELFVERVVRHLGATVPPSGRQQLRAVAQRYSGGQQLRAVAQRSAESSGTAKASFAQLASEIGSRPTWLDFDPKAQCLANRNANPSTVVKAIEWACDRATTFSCTDLPVVCQNNTYRMGDYVFSRLYQELDTTSNPLVHCSFLGASIFASSELYSGWSGSSLCMAGSSTSTLTTTATTSTAPTGPGGTTRPPQPGTSFMRGGAPRRAPGWARLASALLLLLPAAAALR